MSRTPRTLYFQRQHQKYQHRKDNETVEEIHFLEPSAQIPGNIFGIVRHIVPASGRRHVGDIAETASIHTCWEAKPSAREFVGNHLWPDACIDASTTGVVNALCCILTFF